MAWELINEPRCRNCAGTLQAWIEEMARYVKVGRGSLPLPLL